MSPRRSGSRSGDVDLTLGDAVAAIAVVLVAIGLVLSLILLVIAWTPVDEGTVHVLKDRGDATGEVFEPGWHYKMPLVESTVEVDVRPQEFTMSGNPHEGAEEDVDSIRIITQDGQQVNVDVTVRYIIQPEQAVTFYEQWNALTQLERRAIRPTVDNVVRDEGSSYPAREVITREGRTSLGEVAHEALQSELDGTGVTVQTVQIRAMHLHPEFESSLENIEIASAHHEEEVIRANADAEAEVIRAEGDAQAYQIRGDAIQANPEILTEQYIDALAGADTIYVVPEGQAGNPQMMLDATNAAGGNETATEQAAAAQGDGE